VSSSSPPEVRFFIDRSLGAEIFATALREGGCVVLVHDDHFPADTPDPVWLAEAGRNGWVVVTKDKRIRFRPIEKAAFRAAGVRVFVFAQGSRRVPDLAKVFVDALPRIHRFIQNTNGPFIASVSMKGDIRLLT
jgi:hypothetical protein